MLQWVAAGSADVGFVYKTDAASKSTEVKVVAEAPEGSLASPVIYPVGITAKTTRKEAAQKLMTFLQSSEALAVFSEYGFTPNK